MGRGRAKAKQTKVARELKYNAPQTDLDRLRAELAGEPVTSPPPEPVGDEDDDYDDPYAAYVEDDDEVDEDEDVEAR